MARKTRRDVLKLAMIGGAGALAGISAPSVLRAQSFPSRPIRVVVPFAPGGYSDRLSRVAAPFLEKKLGQPLQIVYQPGGGTVLGHSYLLNQAADGYTICNTAVTYIPLSIAQGIAPFKADAFSMINLPSRDYTLIASTSTTPIADLAEVIQRLRKNPSSLSLGIQASSVDYVNAILLLRAAGVDTGKLRVVTYDGGAPVMNATAGGQVDIGFAGGDAFIPLKEKIKPLAGFWKDPLPGYESTPSVTKVSADLGFKTEWMDGAQRGWIIQAALKERSPEIYKILVDAFEETTKDPAFINASNIQKLPSTWYGPEASTASYMIAVTTLDKYASLLKKA